MQPYAIKIDGVEGFVQLTQKPDTPAPEVGQQLFGHLESVSGKYGSFQKFKKVNPDFQGGSKPQSGLSDNRALELLEAIAVAVGADIGDKKSVEEVMEVEDRPLDLSEIPF